jgi:FkbM family methyltransferase
MSNPTPGDLTAYLAKPTTPARLLRALWPKTASLVILDIGACEGEDSIRYSRLFPSSRVFAFEPLPENQRLIQTNLQRHLAGTVELIPVALGASQGVADFHVSSGEPNERFAGDDWNYGNKSSSLLPPVPEGLPDWLRFNQVIRVQVDTIDAFCSRRNLRKVDFMHMDVQGAEQQVLAGAETTLRTTRALWLEVSRREAYAHQALAHDLDRELTARGFVLLREEWRGDEGDRFYVRSRWWRARLLRLALLLRSRFRRLL